MTRRHGAAGKVWAFPKGKPQWYTASAPYLAMASLSYPLARNLPRGVRFAAAAPIAVPIMRRAFVERAAFSLPCGASVWQELQACLIPEGSGSLKWVFFRSQWRATRFAALGLERAGSPQAFVSVQRTDLGTFHPPFASNVVRIPALLAEHTVEGWTGRRFEVVPRLSRTPTCPLSRIIGVANDVSARLAAVIPRPCGTAAHWRPMHGDFTPWNLREDRAGALWLLDWEDAAWAPPVADLVRYVAAVHSLRHEREQELVNAIIADVPGTRTELGEAGRFWTGHHNFRLTPGENMSDGMERDLARGRREREAFRLLGDG